MKYLSCGILLFTFITLSCKLIFRFDWFRRCHHAVCMILDARANQCDFGAKKTDGCNTCTCNRDGMWACTLMLCENQQTLTSNEVTTVSEVEAQPGINDPGFKCVPNSYFKEDCNSCRCDRTGSFARCTLKACPPQQRVKRTPSEESSEIKIFKTNNHVPKKFISSKDDLNFRKLKFDVCVIGSFKSEVCDKKNFRKKFVIQIFIKKSIYFISGM